LHWVFRNEPYFLFVFDNPLEALSVLNTLEWAVAIADQKMKKMDGLEFLERVRMNLPHTRGIIMTGEIRDIL
jgi:CheY-like chemotaxis protein